MSKRAGFWILVLVCALVTAGGWYVASHVRLSVTRDGQAWGP
jgi:hypothetical protein